MKSFDTFIQEVTAKFAVINDKGDTLSLHMTSKEAESAIKRHEKSLKLKDLKVIPLLKSCGKDMHESKKDFVYSIYDGDKFVKLIGYDKSAAEKAVKKMKGKNLHIVQKKVFDSYDKLTKASIKTHADRISAGEYGRLD